jgi:hypothetical protein
MKSVGEECMTSIGKHCHELQCLGMSRCPRLTDDGFRHVVLGCRKLHRLYINNNAQLSDITCYHIAITAGRTKLPQIGPAEVVDSDDEDYQPVNSGTCQLQVFHMCGCKMLTDTGLSWIFEQHPDLIELNVLGCSVTRGSLLAAMKGPRTTCVIVSNPDWYGFKPMFRAPDKWKEIEYEMEWENAVKIQLAWRRFVAIKVVKRKRLEEIMAWGAVPLQSAFRGRRERRRILQETEKWRQSAAALMVIMRAWHRYQRNKRLKKLAVIAKRLRFSLAMSRLQKHWRMVLLLRDEALHAPGSPGSPNRKMPKRIACTHIQRIWRGCSTRLQLPKKRMQHALWLTRRVQAVVKIQIHFRNYIKMLRLSTRFRQMKRSCVKIRRWWYRVRARMARKAMWRTYIHAAILIQSLFRGHLARKRVKRIRTQRRAEAMTAAHHTIARFFRWSTFMRCMKASASIRRGYHTASGHIQRTWRGHVGRKRVRALHQYYANLETNTQILQEWAATRIQTAWRRVMAVDRVQKILATRPHLLFPGWHTLEDHEIRAPKPSWNMPSAGSRYGSNTVRSHPSLIPSYPQQALAASYFPVDPATPYRTPYLSLGEPSAAHVDTDLSRKPSSLGMVPLPTESESGEPTARDAWELHIDEATGYRYFFNAASGNSIWAAPDAH